MSYQPIGKKVALWLLCFFCPLVFAASVTQFNATNSANFWRVSLGLDKPVVYKVFTLNRPARVVVDLLGVRHHASFPMWTYTKAPINRVRTGRHGKALRIVFDTQTLFKVQSHMVSYPNGRAELFVDLMKTKNTSLSPFKLAKSRKQHVPSKLNNVLKPVLVHRPKRNENIIVVVDPGHGGKDPGATGPRGVHEKTVVLAISKRLARLINQQPGFKAYLTRTSDYYLTLRERLAIARKRKADMFIAIHADAFKNTDARGASVFALSSKGATSEAARWVAERENKSELMSGVNLTDKSNLLKSVLINLSQNATVSVSLKIGADIIKSLSRFASLHHRKVEQAAFVVLKSPDIPSLLVETGFISNPYEERRLVSGRYQQRLALALKKGIVEYFVHHPPPGSYLASNQNQPRQLARAYIVSRGDTLSQIASDFQVSVSALKQFNKLTSSSIKVGQRLRIPNS